MRGGHRTRALTAQTAFISFENHSECVMQNILVTGATGTQGGSVVEHLLSGEYGEYDVYGLTRDASSERATALAARGVTVVEGEMTDAGRMAELCDGMDGVYLVTTFFEAGTDVEREQGITVAEAAAEAGVPHLVYSSVGSADRDTGLAHFESKYAVERRITELGLPATIVRPTFFMQNFGYMLREEIGAGRLPLPLAEGVALDVVDADDIGQTVARAFADPARFAGATIELGGDALTLEEFAAAVGRATGTDITPVRLALDDYRGMAGDEMADMFAWFNEVGYDVDADALADYGIETTDFESFLAASDAFRPAPAASR
jgi:uncharacterized protein YbjT (DUF2867 family)